MSRATTWGWVCASTNFELHHTHFATYCVESIYKTQKTRTKVLPSATVGFMIDVFIARVVGTKYVFSNPYSLVKWSKWWTSSFLPSLVLVHKWLTQLYLMNLLWNCTSLFQYISIHRFFLWRNTLVHISKSCQILDTFQPDIKFVNNHLTFIFVLLINTSMKFGSPLLTCP